MTVPTQGREADLDALRREIAEAFADRPRPAEDAVALSRPGCPGYEGDEAREWLAGRDWRSVRDAGVGIEHRDLLSFLTVEGWIYYFPAFADLALDITHPAEMDESLVFRLAAEPEEIAEALSQGERRVVARFLESVADAYDRRGDTVNFARQALGLYWDLFTEHEQRGDGPEGSNASQENGDVPS